MTCFLCVPVKSLCLDEPIPNARWIEYLGMGDVKKLYLNVKLDDASADLLRILTMRQR